jgi:polar amino acid transport system substrate-binding protein
MLTGRIAKACIGLLVGSVMALAAGAANAETTMDKMLKEKTLRVGWIMSPPGAQKDPRSGELGGYYIDMVRFILEQINVKPEFVETKWGTFAAGLQSHQFDLVVAGTFASIPRAASLAFTRPIFYMGYAASVRKGDTRFKTLADIDKPGVKVAVVQGSGGHEFVKRTFKNAEIVVLGTADLSASLVEVQAGRADVSVEDAWATQRYVQAHPQLVNLFADNPYNLQPIGWALRPDDHELRQFFDTSLEWMRINGKTEEFVKKYPASGRFVIKETYRAIE